MPYAEGLFTLFVLSFSSLVSAWMKMLHHDPRPFWTHHIDNWDCNMSYGNPSGHNIYLFSQYPVMFYLLFHAKMRERYSLDWNYNRRNFTYIFSYVTIAILFTLIALAASPSRIWAAAHSIDQLIYGFMVGIGIFVY